MTLEMVEQEYHRELEEMIFFPEPNYKDNSQALSVFKVSFILLRKERYWPSLGHVPCTSISYGSQTGIITLQPTQQKRNWHLNIKTSPINQYPYSTPTSPTKTKQNKTRKTGKGYRQIIFKAGSKYHQ